MAKTFFILRKQIIPIFIILFSLNLSIAQIGIGTNTPNASAVLELQSTEKGFLPPRISTSERNGISSPAEGLVIYNLTDKQLEFFNGTSWISVISGLITSGPCAGEATTFMFSGQEYGIVGSSGKCWLDRNLGASRVATSSNDANSYGDLYQWGRAADGHQIRTSATTSILSNSDIPGNGNFILSSSTPYDWRDPQNNNLWQGVNGVNNPCPAGYRLPTEAELNNERISWSSNNPAGAFASPLKLPLAGIRLRTDGSVVGVGTEGHYWSSTVGTTTARKLYFITQAGTQSGNRAFGYSVRCLKD